MYYLFFLLILFSSMLLLFENWRSIGIKMLILIFMILMIVYANISLNSAKNGLNLFLYAVFPSLFPFFIINDFMMASGITENIARLFNKPIKFLFKTSGYGAYAFIISIFSGYPAGAKVVSELIKAKKISIKEGEKILTFSSTSGPLFIIGAVGIGMLKSKYIGYLLFSSHILAAILNGMLYNFFYNIKYISCSPMQLKDNSLLNFQNAIKNSLITMGYILGYIVFFCVIINLLDTIQFFKIIEVLINIAIKSDLKYISIILKSIFEISNGCKEVSVFNASMEFKVIIISFLLGFSGISIIYQVKGILDEFNINIKFYVLSKLTQGIISSFICYVIYNTINIGTTSFNIFNNYMGTLYLTSCFMFLILIFILNTLSFVLSKN